MVVINFPSSPSVDDTYTFQGKTWKWNGSGWIQDLEAFATAAQGALADSAVQPARQVLPGNGLNGGGDLSGDVTIGVNWAESADALNGTNTSEVMNVALTREMLDERPPGVKVRWTNTANETPVATDRGGFIGLGSTYTGDFTLPDNLGAGFAVTVFNQGTSPVDVVSGGSSYVVIAGPATAGTFTLEPKGLFTAVDTGGGYWIVTGVGLS